MNMVISICGWRLKKMPNSQELIHHYLKKTKPTKYKTSYKDKPLSYKTIQRMMKSEK